MLALCQISRIADTRIRIKASEQVSLNLLEDLMEIKIYDPRKGPLGTIRQALLAAWNAGELPVEPGEHEAVAFVPDRVQIYYRGSMLDCQVTASLTIKQQRFEGELTDAQLAAINGEGPEVPMPDLEKDWRELGPEEESAAELTFRAVKQY